MYYNLILTNLIIYFKKNACKREHNLSGVLALGRLQGLSRIQYKYFYIFAGFMDTLKQHLIGWCLITLTYPISVRCHVLDLILINDY